MKFTGLKLFRGSETPENLVRYISVDLANSLRDLTIGLNRLKLLDNFEGFEASFTFAGSDEQSFRHNAGFIPSQRIVVRADFSTIIDGPTAWTKEFVYMKKTDAGAGTATVIFLR